jgi:hypothetical protein
MGRGTPEKVALLQVRVSLPAAKAIKDLAALERRPVSHACRRILEDCVNDYDLPLPMSNALERDRKARRLDKRSYLIDLLANRYRESVESPRQLAAERQVTSGVVPYKGDRRLHVRTCP